MKAIILCAGYATRMYPLTKDRPKHLLPLAGVPALTYLLRTVSAIHEVDEVFVVSNEKFYAQFNEWARHLSSPKPLHIINDGTRDENVRLGFWGDTALAIREKNIKDDVLVMAGDNILLHDLQPAVAHFKEKGTTILTCQVADSKMLSSYNEVKVDAQGQVISFIEKPKNPSTRDRALCLYLLSAKTLPQINNYLSSGGDPDKAGRFLEWIYTREPVFAFPWKHPEYDIGSIDNFHRFQNIFANKFTS